MTRERRKLFVADAPAEGVALPVQGELQLQVIHRIIEDTWNAVRDGLTAWKKGAPPCLGWWDVRTVFADGHAEDLGRLWFEPFAQGDTSDQHAFGDGMWQQRPGPGARQLGWASTYPANEWRGLQRPWPFGYRYPVPDAPRFRATLGGE